MERISARQEVPEVSKCTVLGWLFGFDGWRIQRHGVKLGKWKEFCLGFLIFDLLLRDDGSIFTMANESNVSTNERERGMCGHCWRNVSISSIRIRGKFEYQCFHIYG